MILLRRTFTLAMLCLVSACGLEMYEHVGYSGRSIERKENDTDLQFDCFDQDKGNSQCDCAKGACGDGVCEDKIGSNNYDCDAGDSISSIKNNTDKYAAIYEHHNNDGVVLCMAPHTEVNDLHQAAYTFGTGRRFGDRASAVVLQQNPPGGCTWKVGF